MYDRFAMVQAEMCRLDKITQNLKLQAISGANNPYSLIDIYGPGHTVHVAGAVAYITRCTPIDAQVAPHSKCTKEIPCNVTRHGTTMKKFANPFTYNLTDFPHELPCSDIMPVRWFVNRTWLCSTPQTHECGQPEQLKASTVTLGEEEFSNFLGMGLYSREQQEQHRLFIRNSGVRGAILSRSATAAVQNAKGEELGSPLTHGDVQTLGGEIGDLLLPLFIWTGTNFLPYIVYGLLFYIILQVVYYICRQGKAKPWLENWRMNGGSIQTAPTPSAPNLTLNVTEATAMRALQTNRMTTLEALERTWKH